MKIITLIAILAFAACPIGTSHAAQATDGVVGAQFAAFAMSSSFISMVHRTADEASMEHCGKKAAGFTLGRPHVFESLAFGSPGNPPLSGMWSQVFSIQACGKTIERNILFRAMGPARGIERTMLLPGDTGIHPFFQAVARKKILESIGPACASATIANTEMSSRISAESWMETWTVDSCGKSMKVPILVIRNKKNGSIEVFISGQSDRGK